MLNPMPTNYTESLSITFGNWLRSQRRRLDWTQEVLAANTFCSVSTIRKIESGDLAPSRALAEQLAHTFGISPQQQADFLAFARGLSADFLADALPPKATLPSEKLPVRSMPEATVYRVPAPLTALIGREREVLNGVALLRRANVRVMTLIGPPGAGKTRLCLALGEALHLDFAQGVCFVPLAPISDPAFVLSAIAQALLLREVAGVPLAQTLHEYLRDKHLLLVLDNFEQVTEAAPRVAELLMAAPRVKVLASSREPLRLYGEQEFPVLPLAVPDINQLPTPDLLEMYPAVELFLQRAQAVRPGFAVDAQNAASIAHICAWLDGLPLALEMAAAQVKWKSPAALLAQLRQQLMGLTGGQRDLTPRQQTLAGAIDWSYKLLSWAEQELLMAVSVTNGGCGLAVAAELSATDATTCEILLRGLAEKSLLQWGSDSLGEVRISLLQMIREYAQARSVEEGRFDQLRELHGTIYHRLVRESLPLARGAQAEGILNRLEIEHNNLRAALAWHLTASSVGGVRLATLLADSLWGIRGYFSEGRLWLEKLLAAASTQSTDGSAETPGWCAAARMALGQGDLPGANDFAARAASLAFANENDDEIRLTLRCQASITLHQSDYPQAIRLYQQLLSLCRPNNQGEAAMALNGLGLIAKDQGDFATALAYHERARAFYARLGDAIGLAHTLTYASIAAYWQAEYARCFDLAQEAIELQKGVGDVMSVAYSRDVQGMALVRLGRYAEGMAILQECIVAFEEVGDRSGEAMVLADLGGAAQLQGNFADAYRYNHTAFSIATAIGDRRRVAFSLEGMAMALTRLSVAAAKTDAAGLGRAVGLFAQANSLRREINSPLPASERAEYDACLALVAAHLSAERYTELWERRFHP